MRLFVAVWPSPELRALLAAVPRPDEPGVRWTTSDQWHVTLAFLGEVAEEDVAGLTDAVLGATGAHAAREAAVGPVSRRLGRTQLVLPVRGVDDLADTVQAEAAVALGRPRDQRPFRGHLTLARSKGKHPIPRSLEGSPLEATWAVHEVALVRSHLGTGPARYETMTSAPLRSC